MTVLDLVKSMLRLIGAISPNKAPKADQVQDAIEALNLLLAEWHNDPLLSFTEQQIFTMVSGTSNYMIGTGMTWNGHRPLKILAATITKDSIDYQLRIICDTEYLESVKSSVCMPPALFYSPQETCGNIYLLGKPDQNYSITILSQMAFTPYAPDGSDTITLPNGYVSALKYNGALEIFPEYDRDPSAFIIKRAADTLAAIRRTNLKKPKPIRYDNAFPGANKTSNKTSNNFLSRGAV